jgi:hypothetical protein
MSMTVAGLKTGLRDNSLRIAAVTLALLVGPPATLVPAFAAGSPEPDVIRDKVVRAASATYVHGMTEEIALSEVGHQGLPVLRELLADPDFPRRDNVVAMLSFLGGGQDTEALLRFLESPAADVTVPEEDRALLLTPQGLGRIAFAGDRGAMAALLEMTDDGSNGAVLGQAASFGPNPQALRDDLIEMSLLGLAYSGTPEARGRLAAIATGRVTPARRGRSLVGGAKAAIGLFDRMHGRGPTRGFPTEESADSFQDGGGIEAGSGAGALDTEPRVHDAGLTYANHVAVSDPMTDARLDEILGLASLRAGRGDFAEDVACCMLASRSGTAGGFGRDGDGLDVIDNYFEQRAVLNNPVARFKVVRIINYCGGPGSNIIGCAWRPGNGAAVVRMSDEGTEAVLWLHEYGHNVGLPHNNDSARNIMYHVDYGTNDALNQSECNRYHYPSRRAEMTAQDKGVCFDVDGDLVQDGLDNCPGVANHGQSDGDTDGVGDACDWGGDPFCENGTMESGEECDGADLGSRSCESLGYDGGVLGCTTYCALDASGCYYDDLDGDDVTARDGDPRLVKRRLFRRDPQESRERSR